MHTQAHTRRSSREWSSLNKGECTARVALSSLSLSLSVSLSLSFSRSLSCYLALTHPSSLFIEYTHLSKKREKPLYGFYDLNVLYMCSAPNRLYNTSNSYCVRVCVCCAGQVRAARGMKCASVALFRIETGRALGTQTAADPHNAPKCTSIHCQISQTYLQTLPHVHNSAHNTANMYATLLVRCVRH